VTSPGRDSSRPVRTVFLGSGDFAVPILRALARHPSVRLVGVVTAPPRAAGRRLELAETPVAVAAADLGIEPVLTPARLRSPEAVAAVRALDPGLAVLADYGQIVPPDLLDLAHGALNLHPSLLPRHRGASPIPAAILAGETETGVSLMRMDEGLDTGPIVATTPVALRGDETTPELEATLAQVAADLLTATLDPWLRGARPAVPQSPVAASMTRPLRREDGRLDPAKSAVELERAVRAYRPWPGTFIETVAGRLAILAADADPAGRTASGRLDADGLGTAKGTLRLVEVQPAGGRAMPWDAYVRGRPAVVGSVVTSAR